MKIIRITYWISSTIYALWMLANAYFYLASAEAIRICRHFGFPDYFRIELAIAKIIGVLVLLLPVFRGRSKEWVYSAFSITVISGFIAHLASGDTPADSVSALIALAILIVSYLSYHQLNLLSLKEDRI